MKLINVLLEQENTTESVKTTLGSMALAALSSLGTVNAAVTNETLPGDVITVVDQQKHLKYANNPGNIRYNSANKWLGQVKPNSGFAQFSDVKYGIRALIKLLKKYEQSYKLIRSQTLLQSTPQKMKIKRRIILNLFLIQLAWDQLNN